MKNIKYLSLVFIMMLVLTGCGKSNKNNINDDVDNSTNKVEDKTLKCSGNFKDENGKDEILITFNFKDDKLYSANYNEKITLTKEDIEFVSIDDVNNFYCDNDRMSADNCNGEIITKEVAKITANKTLKNNDSKLFLFDWDTTKYNSYKEVKEYMEQGDEENEDDIVFICE